MNELFLFVKHPYAAGIIGVIWIGSTVMFAFERDLPIISIVMFNMLVSFVIAIVGFRTGR